MTKINTACIIDDDPIFIFGTKKIMKMADFCSSFLIYNDGEKAIIGLTEIIKSGSKLPDLILLDLNMPIMDGWEFLDKFIEIPSKESTTIFIVTSSIDPADFERAKNYQNVSNYVVKPITKEALTEMAEMMITGQ
ncbi:response regulator [Patiriisocius marinistellae]|uniref:Response regulator n=1 Tax=Patiriisocius marinistellae TaxID=2494560 RepID=A0A5J4G0V2_9FLAO|nr:response regulator [Patiriisocius marinistellae]GEQ87222.1 response regulator [Patiriisocius marinistellae]